MPFTPAHAAAALPLLHRRWLSSTGLVIGSMAPDFEYFLRLSKYSRVSHDLAGILVFNLPITLLLALVFHELVREPVIRFLPPFLRQRALAAAPYPDWLPYLRQHWLKVSVSAVLGSFTHLAWDSFTYSDAYMVQHLPVLQESVRIPLLNTTMMACRLVQHVSSVVGLAVIGWYIYRLPAAPLRQQGQPWLGFWGAVFCLGLLFLFLNLLLKLYIIHEPNLLVVTLISGWLLALLLAGTVVSYKTRKG